MTPITLEQFRELRGRYFREAFIGRSRATIRRNNAAMDYYEEFTFHILAKPEVDLESTADYATWLDHVDRTRKRQGKQMSTSAVIRFFRWLMRVGLMNRPPSMIIDSLPFRQSPPKPAFTVAEYERLKKEAIGTVCWWPIVSAWATGMSIIDVSLLTTDEVDLDNWCIHKRRAKSNAPCIIPIITGSDFHEALLEKLKNLDLSHPEHKPEEGVYYVDPNLANLYRSSSACGVMQPFDRIKEKAGIDRRKTFHSLRVSFCSMMANSNMSLALACKMSGHTDPETFVRRYLKVDPKVLHKVLAEARNKQAERDGEVFL